MQSGKLNTKNWLLEFDTLDKGIDPLMGWETSNDTMSEVKLEFLTKDLAISYAKKNNINFYNHLTHLLIHSFLHINGYVHNKIIDFNKMKKIEIKVLNKVGIGNPYLKN